MTRPKNIIDDTELQFRLTESSDRHYAYWGTSYIECLRIAEDIVQLYKKGSSDSKKIIIAVVPHPNHNGKYLIEDRSIH